MAEKILYLHRTQGQGAEGSHIRGMVDGFREHGCTVDIVGPPGVDPYRLSSGKQERLSRLGKMFHWFADQAPQWCFELVELLYNGVAFIRLARQWRKGGGYSFIYERYSLNSFAGTLFAALKKVPLVLEVNDATIIERSRPLTMMRMARWLEKRILHKAHLVITITNQFKELLIEHHDLAENKILVLPNAIDPRKYELDESRRLTRKQLSIPEDSVVLGCVGAFVPWHGLEFFVRTMAPYCESDNFYFLFVGDGPVRKEVEESAKALGVSHRLRFTGFVSPDDVPYYLDLVDICVIPGSNAHCSPMKLFEYMAAGKPVVLPRYKPLLEIVTDGQEGLFFFPHGASELKHSLRRLMSFMELRKQLGCQGRKLVLKQYTWRSNSERVWKKMGEE